MGTTDAATRGKELYETCVPCHQQDGSGNSVIGAPNIAGMSDWYVEEQLKDFRDDARGAEFQRYRRHAHAADGDEPAER